MAPGSYCITGQKVSVDGVFSLQDKYDWQNPGDKSVVLDGVRIYDKWAMLVENYGMARPFDVVGSASWKANLAPPPQSQPASQPKQGRP